MATGRRRSAVLALSLTAASVLLAACLGQDYKRIELSIRDVAHGWLAVVEPGERFAVLIAENPLYPGAMWTPAGHDPAVITMLDSFFDPYPQGNPSEVPEAERGGIPEEQLGLSIFELEGAGLGESPLMFELLDGGRRVGIAEFTVAVVRDACEGDRGLAAARCRREIAGPTMETADWDHGGVFEVVPGETITLSLTANALHPARLWEVVEYDASVVRLTGSRRIEPRAPGNFDLADPAQPGSFLPQWEFALDAVAPGESALRFEVRVDGEPIEMCEFTVVVVGEPPAP